VDLQLHTFLTVTPDESKKKRGTACSNTETLNMKEEIRNEVRITI